MHKKPEDFSLPHVTSSRYTQQVEQETVLGHGTFHHENGTFWSFNLALNGPIVPPFPLPGAYASAF